VTSPEKKGPALAPDPDAFKDIDDASTRKKATINDTSDNGSLLFDPYLLPDMNDVIRRNNDQ
jgi:hypothetical protein